PRGKRGDLLTTGDGDLAALEWLAQPFDDVGLEERKLVEEEGPGVGAADLTGMDPAAAATEHPGPGRRVVRCPERRPGEHALSRRQASGQRVDRAQLQGLLEREVRQDARQSLRQGGLSRAL